MKSDAGLSAWVEAFFSRSLFFVLLSERLFELGETFLHCLSPG